ncbi:MAG: endopeptidase La [Gammaproteobacteria bacterium]|nr:endopeptidase La [Gammaproteobacteria bacterium]
MDNLINNLKTKSLPLLPLRDLVIFPKMLAPIFLGRIKSISALEIALKSDNRVIVVTQKEANEEYPGSEDVYRVGCLVKIMQVLKLPDNTVKVLIEGISRVQIIEVYTHAEHFVVDYTELEDEVDEIVDEKKPIVELTQELLDKFEQFVKLSKKVSPENLANIKAITEVNQMIDMMVIQMTISVKEKQEILETLRLIDRLELVLEKLEKEVEILNVNKKIKGRVKRQMEKNQREFYLHEQVKAIQKELGDGEENYIEEIQEKLKSLKLPAEVQKKANDELKKLKLMPSLSAEATVVRNYLDVLLGLPWSKKTKIKHNLANAEKILNEDHFGLEKVKERILEYLAVHQRVEKSKATILCLVGPPGVGKTSLGKSIARATGRNYVRMALGGMRDEAEIRGHRRTYIGAMPGKILQNLAKSKTRNPLFLLDEIDKLGNDYRGDPSSALLEVLDPEQNSTFTDHYVELEFDLSDVMFVATANSAKIQMALLDRMEVVTLSGYTEIEKLKIARQYLIPKQIKYNGLHTGEAEILDEAVQGIISSYTREAGVRSLEREIAKICRKIVKAVLLKKQTPPVIVDAKNLTDYLGQPKYDFGKADTENRVGKVNGLAWTEVGGDILIIESAVVAGKGNIIRTGSLGDVMKESIEAARTVVRSRANQWGILTEDFEKKDIHIHAPDGATPKDGPSAGIAIVTAMVSSLTNTPVRSDVAMTGEITLRGEVTAIGGLKEKLMAALRGNVKVVLIPSANEKDLTEIDQDIVLGLKIVPVKWIEEVIEIALEPRPPNTLDDLIMLNPLKGVDNSIGSAS